MTGGLTRGMRGSRDVSINLLKDGTVLGTLDRGKCTSLTCRLTSGSACPS